MHGEGQLQGDQFTVRGVFYIGRISGTGLAGAYIVRPRAEGLMRRTTGAVLPFGSGRMISAPTRIVLRPEIYKTKN